MIDEEKVLTKEIADEFVEDDDSVDLKEFTALEEGAYGAAEILSWHKGDLSLTGLTELSDAAAESLSKHYGCLHLEGLTELSEAAVESLSKHMWDTLTSTA